MTLTLKGVQMLDSSSRSGKTEPGGDLPEGRGVAFNGNVIPDVIQDLLLTVGQVFH